ncbi:GntR family transcriptional regulator [Mesorhizobium sp. ORM6]
MNTPYRKSMFQPSENAVEDDIAPVAPIAQNRTMTGSNRTGSMWIPRQLVDTGPRYMAIVAALAEDIEHGEVGPGDRLMPQRDLAHRLGVSVGTVVRAYRLAEQRGLIGGEIGRGTYVKGLGANTEQAFSGMALVFQTSTKRPQSTSV